MTIRKRYDFETTSEQPGKMRRYDSKNKIAKS